ncbi:hypothetical protein K435DRAFT_871355 [Dendrothele bispora CBS 962.96]|uniref:Uncharacterized protein n=1 Tax=Dendrothele bispora (strain CBS 962.96) TaxID=1314807 RepID=A0A4S8L499_DENBC|nr:hypothetical protein K435DRAFT_871355 [Dendrothele bispora CBS 962.96]
MTHLVNNSLKLPIDVLQPEDLATEEPPTAVQHANSIESWVKFDFKRVIEDTSIRFEHKHYGSKNTFLTSVFPIQRRFSVVPQGLLRQDKSHLPNLAKSVGSTGGQHYGRENDDQRENDRRCYPDFTVVKVIPTDPSTPRIHYLLCVIEIKHHRVSKPEDKAGMASQMLRYMVTCIKHRYRDPHLKGFLMYGRYYQKFEIDGNFVNYVPYELLDMYAPGDPLTIALCQIAIQEWNRMNVHDMPLAEERGTEDPEVFWEDDEEEYQDGKVPEWLKAVIDNSMDESTDESTDESMDESTDESMDESTDESTDGSMDLDG